MGRQPKVCQGLSRSIKFCCGLPRSPNPTPQLEPEPGVVEAQIDASARRRVVTRIELIITECIYKCVCVCVCVCARAPPLTLCTSFFWFGTINLGSFIVCIEGSQVINPVAYYYIYFYDDQSM